MPRCCNCIPASLDVLVLPSHNRLGCLNRMTDIILGFEGMVCKIDSGHTLQSK